MQYARGLANAVAEPYGAGIPVLVMYGRKPTLAARSGSARRVAMIDRSVAAWPLKEVSFVEQWGRLAQTVPHHPSGLDPSSVYLARIVRVSTFR